MRDDMFTERISRGSSGMLLQESNENTKKRVVNINIEGTDGLFKRRLPETKTANKYKDIPKNEQTIIDIEDVEAISKECVEMQQTKIPVADEVADGRKITSDQIAQVLQLEYDFAVLNKQLHVYRKEKGVWELIPETEANRIIRKMIPKWLRSKVNKNTLYEVFHWLLVEDNECFVSDNKNRFMLNFLDQAVNWKTGECTTNRKEYYFTYALQVNYSEMGKSEEFKYFLNDVFKDDEKTKTEFIKFLGLALSDIRNLKLSFFAYGPSNTGKTVVLNLLKKIVGEEYCSAISFSQMSNEFALTQLLGKRMNLSGEVSGATNKRLDIYKSITGNDLITTSFKGKDHFTFQNRALLVFACNNFPPIQDVVEFESFLSRVIMFPFLYPKSRDEWIPNYEDILFGDVGTIIKYAIKGLKMLEQDGFVFKESPAMKEIKEDFLGTFNSFALFSKYKLRFDDSATESSANIQREYNAFCKQHEYLAIASNVWPQLLKQQFDCRQVTVFDERGKRVRAYKGIRILQDDDMD